MADSITGRLGAGLPMSHTYGYQVLRQKKEYDHDTTVPADATWTPFESHDEYAFTETEVYLTFYKIGVKVFFTVTKGSKGENRSIRLDVTWTKNGGLAYIADREIIINWLQLLSNTSSILTMSPIFLVCDNFEGMYVLLPCSMNNTYPCGSFAVRRKVSKPSAVLARLMNLVPSSKDENNLYIQSMLKALQLRSDDTKELIPSDGGARVIAPYLTDEDTSAILRGALLGLEPEGKVIRWCNLLTGYDLELNGAHWYCDTSRLVGDMWKTQGAPVITPNNFDDEYSQLSLPTLTEGTDLYEQWASSAVETDHNGALIRAGKYGIQYGQLTGNESFIPEWLQALIT
jgi:hypothetical protein